MKRFAVFGSAALILTVAFIGSPFLGLYRIDQAIESRNTSALSDRVDFKRLRMSLGIQIVSTYMHLTGKDERLGKFGTALGLGLGASLADPLLADLVNADAMLDLLSGAGVTAGPMRIPAGIGALGHFDPGDILQLVANTEYGFGRADISLPLTAEPAQQYRVHLQVLQSTWKITGVDLPENVRTQLAKELQRRIG